MKSFLQDDEVYFFARWNPMRKISQKDGYLKLVDERDKIELIIKKEEQNQIESMVRWFMTRRKTAAPTQSIKWILTEQFKAGAFANIAWKAYLIYDIETDTNVENLKETEFLIAYSMEIDAEGNSKYEYIDKKWLEKFVQKLLDFDGYIIGFNHIAFDNPVCIYSTNRSEEELQILNDKSLDIFLFVWAITGKRIWLNKLSEAFVGVQKTLESGAEWEVLYRQYLETGDESFLNEFKKYCKNDVRMTALVLYYLLHFKKIFMWEKEHQYEIEDFLAKSGERKKNDKISIQKKKWFFT